MNQDMLQLLAVQHWFYREARILDARRYDLWLEQLDERIRYRIPSRSYVCAGNVEDFSTWAVERELDLPDSLPLIDDEFTSLRERVGRLQSGMAWADTAINHSTHC
jgi:3-phenylpropionate/cinnamic acid dioxygenase small subunit